MFLVLEGPDGSGKTTLCAALTERLKARGIPALSTYEPTRENPYGREIRRLLQEKQVGDPVRFCDLMTEDRRRHLADTIFPALASGSWVVCDRYKYSALVYQSLQGVPAAYVAESNQSFRVPDAAWILRPRSVDTLFSRMGGRSGQAEYFEKRDFLERTMDLYARLPAFFPGENLRFLDAERPVSALLDEMEESLGLRDS